MDENAQNVDNTVVGQGPNKIDGMPLVLSKKEGEELDVEAGISKTQCAPNEGTQDECATACFQTSPASISREPQLLALRTQATPPKTRFDHFSFCTNHSPTDAADLDGTELEILASKSIEEESSGEGSVFSNFSRGHQELDSALEDTLADPSVLRSKEPEEVPYNRHLYCADRSVLLFEEPEEVPNGNDDSKSHPYCPICFENVFEDVDIEEASTKAVAESKKEAVTVNECKHVFCSACLIKSIESNVKIRRVPCPCPHHPCSEYLSADLVATLLSQGGGDKKLLAKYERLEKLQKDPSLVECTKCEGVFDPEKDDTTGLLSCAHCGHSFCKEHGDAHAGMSCQEWLKTKGGRGFRQTEKRMKRLTKPCPHCSVQIQKVNGCNHVHCTNCNQHMCWACGGDWESGGRIHTCPLPKILRPCFCLCSCSEGTRELLSDLCQCFYEWVAIGFLILAFLLVSLIWAAAGMALALVSGCFFGSFCCWNSREWGVWSPKKGLQLCLVLVFLPFAKSCFEDELESKFPGLSNKVDVAIANVLSALRACCRPCCRSDFPVMQVAKRGGGVVETGGKTNNDSINETMPRSSEGEHTV